jgi:hypothetical protein
MPNCSRITLEVPSSKPLGNFFPKGLVAAFASKDVPEASEAFFP